MSEGLGVIGTQTKKNIVSDRKQYSSSARLPIAKT